MNYPDYNRVWNIEERYTITGVSDSDYKRFYSDKSKYILIRPTGYEDNMHRPIYEEDFLITRYNTKLVVHYIQEIKEYYAFDMDGNFPIRLSEVCGDCYVHGNVYRQARLDLEKLERTLNKDKK